MNCELFNQILVFILMAYKYQSSESPSSIRTIWTWEHIMCFQWLRCSFALMVNLFIKNVWKLLTKIWMNSLYHLLPTWRILGSTNIYIRHNKKRNKCLIINRFWIWTVGTRDFLFLLYLIQLFVTSLILQYCRCSYTLYTHNFY
jgi:hypothetical protein